MHETRLTIDPLNPGQFYACCGLLDWVNGNGIVKESWFVTDSARPKSAEFVVATEVPIDLTEQIRGLRDAACERDGYFDNEELNAVAPVEIVAGDRRLMLDWWLDEFHSRAIPLKCWAGQQTSLSILSELLTLLPAEAGSGFLSAPAMTTSRFGVDPRSAWTALDFGFSPNEQKRDAATFPGTEVLAAIGLQGFRPARVPRSWKYGYFLWEQPLAPGPSRLAASGGWDGLAGSPYEFELSKRGSYKFFEFAKGVSRND